MDFHQRINLSCTYYLNSNHFCSDYFSFPRFVQHLARCVRIYTNRNNQTISHISRNSCPRWPRRLQSITQWSEKIQRLLHLWMRRSIIDSGPHACCQAWAFVNYYSCISRHLVFAARAALCVYHARCHWFVHFYVAPAMCGQIRTCDKTNASPLAAQKAVLENCRARRRNKEISYIWMDLILAVKFNYHHSNFS